ncbi:hypothetical protein ACFL27_06305 [candidate division CSSED10-310 bacterium]|uniref:Nucleotidyltransferase family protein n=1 Tax=candidate division CSSED10-310 bacterium TaxID=2855610 RepID=A0ABV6YUD9_UNCC1
MIDLYDELRLIVTKLQEKEVSYALCGGLAMAVFSIPRATIDIDLLIPRESLYSVIKIGESLGYVCHKKVMTFRKGDIQIHRMTKTDPDSEDILCLDLLITTEILRDIWISRQAVEWEHGLLSVVSRQGLIAMKSLRGTGRDKDDIALLESNMDE